MANSWTKVGLGNEDFYLSDLDGELTLHSGPRMERDRGLDHHETYNHRNWTGVPGWEEMTQPDPSIASAKSLPQKASYVDFRGLNVPGLNSANSEFRCIDFRGAELSEAIFFGSLVGGASIVSRGVTRRSGENDWSTSVITVPTSFARANLRAADFRLSDLKCDFREANLDSSVFDLATVVGDFRGANLRGATFVGAYVTAAFSKMIDRVDFSMSRVSISSYSYDNAFEINNCDFGSAVIRKLDRETQISNCSFNLSILPRRLARCVFSNCTFRRASVLCKEYDDSWDDVEFNNCDFQQSFLVLRGDAFFKDCNFSRAKFVYAKHSRYGCDLVFDNCNLDGALFLNCSPQGTYSGSASIVEGEVYKQLGQLNWHQELIHEVNQGLGKRLSEIIRAAKER